MYISAGTGQLHKIILRKLKMPKKGPATVEQRLHRIEGQVRGIERLIKDEEPTQKVVIQLQAVISSLESLKLEIVKNEIKETLLKNLDSAVSMLK